MDLLSLNRDENQDSIFLINNLERSTSSKQALIIILLSKNIKMDFTFSRPQLSLGQECAFIIDLTMALPEAFGPSQSFFLPTNSKAIDTTFFLVNYFPAFVEQRVSTYERQQQVRQKWESTLEDYSQRCYGEIHENVRTLYAVFIELVVQEWNNEWASLDLDDLNSSHVDPIKKNLIDALVKRGGLIDPETMLYYKHLPVSSWTFWAEELQFLATEPKLVADGTKEPDSPGKSKKDKKIKVD
ncbi:hypothetical protein CDD82_4205 [Ophiocordyceps australis]|uniref:Uncharacterized protein n=1 Tax=Ophiocordyceps australis TaxID=1399860 RepID=A0A2C5YD18_9HYPO|nr:hypothetical protein CDD82_4205 [Ophiocordyceps australis]